MLYVKEESPRARRDQSGSLGSNKKHRNEETKKGEE
jgi:hypothetical protein